MFDSTIKSSFKYLVVFNNQLTDGCDYAYQTIVELQRRFPGQVIGWALAESVPWWDFRRWLQPLKSSPKWGRVPLLPVIRWLPGQRFTQIRRINIWLSARWWHWRLWLFTAQSLRLWVFEPFYIPLIAQVFHQSQLLYDSVDDWGGLEPAVQQEHNQVIKRAKWLVVNSLTQWRRYQDLDKPVAQVPLGCAVELFLTLPLPKKMPPVNKKLIFGYVGQLGNRIDIPWLLALAKAWPQHEFRLVGPRQNWQLLPEGQALDQQIAQLLALPNVHWFPGQAKTAMPTVISQFDIGLIPYDTRQHFNLACHPMKLYEYFAAGKPVVATAVTELQRYQKSGAVLTNNQVQPIIKEFSHWFQHRPGPAQLRRIAQTQSWKEKITAIVKQHDIS